MFKRIFVFVTYSLLAFVAITSMEDLGIAMVFGAVYLNLMIMSDKKKDKEEEKDGVD